MSGGGAGVVYSHRRNGHSIPWIWMLPYVLSLKIKLLPFSMGTLGSRLLKRLLSISIVCLLIAAVFIGTSERPLENRNDDKGHSKGYGASLKKITSPVEVFPAQKGDLFRKYQLNVTRSNQLLLDRRIPDTRPEKCKSISYNIRKLPSASIVIPFHNEAWSVFLRTIVSILNRTPSTLLKEIILVDDASDYDYLKDPLKKYLDEFGDSRIQLLRKTKREGLIVARMLGARKAKGNVLVFLDAHVEVNVNWLPPLLQAIKDDPRIIAIPNIDDIQVDNFEYVRWLQSRGGGFLWNLNYEWKYTPSEIEHSSDPFPTATTIGCAMAIQRSYFFEIGAYDEGMLIWGGENLEISFRNWMCGGSLYVYPCSRVGHIFRKYLPYIFPSSLGNTNVIKKNLQRVAEVWMDEYKIYYYASIQQREIFNMFEEASLSKRKRLRERLKCKSFSWYLQNVLPDMPVPIGKPSFHGQLKSAVLNRCLYRLGLDEADKKFELGKCYAYDTNNTFSLTKSNSIVMPSGECLIHNEVGTRLSYDKCSEVLKKGSWEFDTKNADNFKVSFPKEIEKLPLGQIVFSNQYGTACLAASKDVSYPYFMDCNSESIRQFWYFTYEFNYQFV